MARFYIATRLARHAEHNLIRDILVEAGHEITYDWTSHGSVKETCEERLTEVSEAELDGVRDADFVVVLLPAGRGTHAEIGIAEALHKPVYMHSVRPDLFTTTSATCAFYWPRCVKRSTCEWLEEFGGQVLEWWANEPLYLGRRVPGHLIPLMNLDYCPECPVGYREHEDDSLTCPRALLCDWECMVQVETAQDG